MLPCKVSPQNASVSEDPEEIIFPRTRPCETMPFPIEVLPSSLSQYAKETSRAISCPIDLVALPIIVVCGAAIGNTRKLLIKEGHVEPAILYGVTIGDPGSGKSPAMEAVLEPLKKIDSMLCTENEKKIEEYEEKTECYQVEVAQWKEKFKQGENCQKPRKPEQPKELAVITNDATTESLSKLMRENPRGFLLHRDELSGWIRSFGKYRQGLGDDREFFLQNWNNTRTKVSRSTKKTIVNEKSHISVLGTIQPDKLSMLRGLICDGFIDRLIPFFPDAQITRYSEYVINSDVKKAYFDLVERLFFLSFQNQEDNIPYFIPLTSEAKKIWIAYRNRTESEKYECDLSASLRNIWSKIPSQVARVALIFAICEQESQVSEKTVQNAIMLGEYFKNQYKKVFWETETSKEEKEQNAILSWAEKHHKTIVLLRDIVHYGVAGCRNTKQAREKAQSLVEVGAAKWISKGKFEILKEKQDDEKTRQ